MARGFESKAVTDQQESAFDTASESDTPQDVTRDAARLAVLRRLQLARIDVEHHLETAQAPAHREVLRRALEAIDEQMARVR